MWWEATSDLIHFMAFSSISYLGGSCTIRRENCQMLVQKWFFSLLDIIQLAVRFSFEPADFPTYIDLIKYQNVTGML